MGDTRTQPAVVQLYLSGISKAEKLATVELVWNDFLSKPYCSVEPAFMRYCSLIAAFVIHTSFKLRRVLLGHPEPYRQPCRQCQLFPTVLFQSQQHEVIKRCYLHSQYPFNTFQGL
jgi:hypothetical protein